MAESHHAGEVDAGDRTGRILDALGRLGSRDEGTRRRAAAELLGLVDRHPDAAAAVVEEMARNLDAEAAPAREWTLRAMTALAAERPDAVAREFDAVLRTLLDRGDRNRDQAAAVTAELASTHPETVLPAVAGLDDLLNAPRPAAQVYALEGLEALAADYLDEVGPAIRRVVVLLESPDATVRKLAVDCVGTAGAVDPSIVEVADHRLTDRLHDPVPEVREAAFRAVVRVAEEYPGTVASPSAVADEIDRLAPQVGDVDPGRVETAVTGLHQSA